MTRAYLTAKEKDAMLEKQHWLCAMCRRCMCIACQATHWWFRIEYDHSTPNALRPGKPDQAICSDCHLYKTKRDIKAIAKAKRLQRKWNPDHKSPWADPEKRDAIMRGIRLAAKKRKLSSRPFDKRFRKRMDGTVEPRD